VSDPRSERPIRQYVRTIVRPVHARSRVYTLQRISGLPSPSAATIEQSLTVAFEQHIA
jgi:hypothetical protein